MEHRKSRILFWVELITSLSVIGAVLFGAGKMSQVVTDNKDSQKEIISEVKATQKDVSELKSNQKIMMATDSTNLNVARGLLDEVKTLKTRTSRLEWKLKLPPIELENLPSTKSKKGQPISQTITIKEK